MILPILISVSVTPVSYFFWANALLPVAARKTTAVENAAHRRATKDISFLPNGINECVCLLLESACGALVRIEYPSLRVVDLNERDLLCAAQLAQFVNVADPVRATAFRLSGTTQV